MAGTDIVTLINNGILSEISAELGASYGQLAYVYDVVKNNFRSNSNKYGVRPLSSFELDGVVKAVTQTHTFEVVLTEGYAETSISDAKIQAQVLAAFENMQKIYKRLRENKAGVPNSVLDVINIIIEEPEVLEEDKVIVLRANIDILYRIDLT